MTGISRGLIMALPIWGVIFAVIYGELGAGLLIVALGTALYVSVWARSVGGNRIGVAGRTIHPAKPPRPPAFEALKGVSLDRTYQRGDRVLAPAWTSNTTYGWVSGTIVELPAVGVARVRLDHPIPSTPSKHPVVLRQVTALAPMPTGPGEDR